MSVKFLTAGQWKTTISLSRFFFLLWLLGASGHYQDNPDHNSLGCPPLTQSTCRLVRSHIAECRNFIIIEIFWYKLSNDDQMLVLQITRCNKWNDKYFLSNKTAPLFSLKCSTLVIKQKLPGIYVQPSYKSALSKHPETHPCPWEYLLAKTLVSACLKRVVRICFASI